MNAGLLPPLADPPPELQTRPLVLVVNRSPDRRLFLQTSLQGRCRVATASTGAEGAMHLRRCSPRALVAGRASGRAAREALEANLQGRETPATLTLWVTHPSPKWADAALRHPFTRADLLQAVAHLLSGGTSSPDNEQAGTDASPDRSPPRR
ncbi:hypothetical protein [Salinibacter ruber]|uniref:hypothetical protein n=1 Tax=Salinibacter ruber TaxID=146919 RepID=UPI00216A6D84|nr:hypothetical protein [Salinibacter ruber]MCS3640391.1 CheY-like chemotaxis protein [Salinibacter ruber]